MTQHESLTRTTGATEEPFSLLSELDLHLFSEGTHYRLYEKLGCHLVTVNGVAGASFAVWAPDAAYVSVIGDFNAWDRGRNPLRARGLSGLSRFVNDTLVITQHAFMGDMTYQNAGAIFFGNKPLPGYL